MDYSNAFGNGNNNAPSGIDAFGSAPPPPPPLPPGIYMARVEKGEYCTTKTKGEDAYRIVFQVTDGPHVGTTVMRTWTFGEKAMHYRNLPSLREYVLVSHRAQRIEVHRRSGQGTWEIFDYHAGETLELRSIGASF